MSVLYCKQDRGKLHLFKVNTMTKSVRSVNIIVRLDFEGHDVSNETIEEAISNMEYSFTYDDYYLRILNHEIVDSFVKMDS